MRQQKRGVGRRVMRFADPWWLLLLPLVFWWRWTPRPTPAYRIADLRDLAFPYPPSPRLRWRVLPAYCRLAWLATSVVALARPQTPAVETLETPPLRAVVLLVDCSGSMGIATPDEGGPTRLQQVQRRIDEVFADEAFTAADLVALVKFADAPTVVSPLTNDFAAVRALAADLVVDPGENQTALGDALAAGIDVLRTTSAPERRIVLFSDGANTVPDALEAGTAVRIAESLRVPIDVAAVDDEGPDAAARRTTLEETARVTGGRFFPLDDERSAVVPPTASLDAL
ncbi:MAG: VWA domain-containing protein, partial [Planctomycetia bacterium]